VVAAELDPELLWKAVDGGSSFSQICLYAERDLAVLGERC